ncbi:MAG TPA: NADH-quinone oxidoreductase subunit L, partial [Thiolinea sp.]|nr:NADH-quinone oxidoreductase subunit L [Thiolinea sp.]
MNFTGLAGPWPLAAGLQLVPLLAALLLMRLRGQPAFGLALLAVTLELGLATALYLHFDPGQAAGVMQFSEHLPLFGALQYHAGVDGMSVLFVLLSAVLGFLSVVFVLFRQLHGTTILAVIMALQATLMSQFLTLDLLWFCLMGMLQVLLTAYLSWRWPTSADVLPALSRYLQFMFTGLLLLLGGTLILGWSHADQQG